MMKRVPPSRSEKTVQAIWDWYQVQSRLSLEEKAKLLDEVRNSRPVSEAIFFGMSIEEIHEFFRELDYLAMPDLLSATEAAIRLDYLNRAYRGKGDDVSRRFRQLYKKKRDRVSLERDVLEAWKRLAPRTRAAVGDFTGAMNLRHWLAHGRYWNPKLGRDYSPADVYDISYNLLQAIGA